MHVQLGRFQGQMSGSSLNWSKMTLSTYTVISKDSREFPSNFLVQYRTEIPTLLGHIRNLDISLDHTFDVAIVQISLKKNFLIHCK